MISYEFCEIFKNPFVHRTPPMVASGSIKTTKWRLSTCLNWPLKVNKFSCLVSNGVRTIAPEENWPPDNCPLDDCPLDYCSPENFSREKLSPGQLPPTWLPPDYCVWTITPKIIAAWQYPPLEIPLGWFVTYIIAPRKTENCLCFRNR